MKGYSAKDVAKLLDLSVGQVRSYARAGFLHPQRGLRGEYRFTFQDLVLLRTAKGLMAARIPPRKVRRALRRLKQQLPTGRPLSGVQIAAQGDRIVVRHGGTMWNPESGQAHFDFEVSELAEMVAPRAREAVEEAKTNENDLNADDWYTLGSDLEAAAPDHAREAYRRALELDPMNVDARVNLGRLLHETGQYRAAESHYRMALKDQPDNSLALFNLGVCLEDRGLRRRAMHSYLKAIEADQTCADAYFNLARLYEQAGDSKSALRYLKTYRELTRQ